LKSEAVPLSDALGRTLRQDVVSDIAFHRLIAHMDGYAVLSDDLASASPESGVTLRAIGGLRLEIPSSRQSVKARQSG
jgi:molybdopterin biosynthesis enzyme